MVVFISEDIYNGDLPSDSAPHAMVRGLGGSGSAIPGASQAAPAAGGSWGGPVPHHPIQKRCGRELTGNGGRDTYTAC